MKSLEEIKADKHIKVKANAMDGFSGEINFYKWSGSVICSTGAGWEHVSVAPFKKYYTPSWEDMCTIKDMFFNDDEAVIQIHPPKVEYVNNKPNCLHLWRCSYKEMVLPPSILVGVRKGQTHAEVRKEILQAYEMAGEELK